ncbi:FAD-dependent oxidoreductase [Rhizobium sp. F40D2]|uniref:FAD-dependent oxidoreductase n=1 Tax=Rhizobium sp. F40D2 TaxID=3453141 RepID=UPI003F246BD7
MKFASYWHDTSIPFAGGIAAPVSGDFEVAVIGAGFTGLNAARTLAQSGVKVALLEAEHVGYGASGRYGGHLTAVILQASAPPGSISGKTVPAACGGPMMTRST